MNSAAVYNSTIVDDTKTAVRLNCLSNREHSQLAPAFVGSRSEKRGIKLGDDIPSFDARKLSFFLGQFDLQFTTVGQHLNSQQIMTIIDDLADAMAIYTLRVTDECRGAALAKR